MFPIFFSAGITRWTILLQLKTFDAIRAAYFTVMEIVEHPSWTEIAYITSTIFRRLRIVASPEKHIVRYFHV